MKVLLIQRAEQFSPNSVGKDRQILEAVAGRLRQQGYETVIHCESDLAGLKSLVGSGGINTILTMGRLPETVKWLGSLSGMTVINAPEGIANCSRSKLELLMARLDTPRAPKEGDEGYWLKRGDAAAQSADDVQYAADKTILALKIQEMEQRGITDYTVSAHVAGDLLKFYGVCGTGFFRYFYPTDDGDMKFRDELHNGQARHYSFDRKELQDKADALAEAAGIRIYGGDCIVRGDGSFCLIDFNDWPSFSRCREEAADAIASLVM